MLFQPSNITPDEVYGTGTVDLNEDLAVSWRVTGDTPMTAYKIDILQNDASSSPLYSTGKTTLGTPFWGVNYSGEAQYYTATITAAALSNAGIGNGYEYKFLITQWWDTDDYVEQTTASVFTGKSTPTLTMGSIPSPVTGKSQTFTATYYQAQGDGIKWVRWRIAEADSTDAPFLDTGRIYGTGQLQVDYDGFLTGTQYAVKCAVESSGGMTVETAWVTFTVTYSVADAEGSVSVCQIANDSCVWITWDRMPTADGYSIMRQTVGSNRLDKIADVSSTTGQIRDYSARSGSSYIYYIFPSGALAYLTKPLVSTAINVQYWFWTIVEAEEIGDNAFSAVASYVFRYGSGGVSEGAFSNNNSPNLLANFTRYPARQGTTPNYLTGSVGGYIGVITRRTMTYADTVSQSDALFALSTTNNPLFLLDPKGHFLRVHTSGPMSLSIDHKKHNMPQTLTVPWVEIGPTENVHVLMYPGGDFYPQDKVIYTRLELDPQTGKLVWYVPENYEGTGSRLYMQSGMLKADQSGPFTPATLEMDGDTKLVTATVE